MKKMIYLTVVACLFMLLPACEKNNTPKPKTKAELLVQASWKFKSASANGADVSNQVPPFDPCKKDNILTFTVTGTNSGTGVVAEGSTKCDPADPDSVPFTWSLTNNETTLNISASLFTGNPEFTLVSVSETELVVSQGYAPPVGAVILVTITFQH